MSRSSGSTPIVLLLAIALWVGLAYGIVEGVESFALFLLPKGLTWNNGNSVDALMVMPLFYPVVYLVLGLMFVPLALLIRRNWWDLVLLFLLTALSGFLAARNQEAVFSNTASAMLGLGIATVIFRAYRKHREKWAAGFVRRLPLVAAIALLVVVGTYVSVKLVDSRRVAALPAPHPGAPNVLLIILDTDRAEKQSLYGYGRPTTPHLDSLASEGTVFELAYAASSWTLPSHASLFTGRMVHEHKAGETGVGHLGPEYPTLAEQFRDQGYATGGFVANNYWASRSTRLNRGFIHYEDFYGTFGDALQRTVLLREFRTLRRWMGVVGISGRKRASHVNNEFLGWMGNIKDRPWFAFLNYLDLHSPYTPPPPYAGQFSPLQARFESNKREVGAAKDPRPSPEELAYRSDRYDESLVYLDAYLGRLFAELKRQGKLDNTIVIVTSDHGEHFGEHGITEHGASLYAEEIRVPLVLRFPPKVPTGLRVPTAVSTTNLAATILALAGIRDTLLPGRSLLLPPDSSGRLLPIVSEMSKAGGKDPPEWPASKGWVKSLIVDHWHFILLQNGSEELFDILNDPLELNNLAETEAGRPLTLDLHQRLKAIVHLP